MARPRSIPSTHLQRTRRFHQGSSPRMVSLTDPSRLTNSTSAFPHAVTEAPTPLHNASPDDQPRTGRPVVGAAFLFDLATMPLATARIRWLPLINVGLDLLAGDAAETPTPSQHPRPTARRNNYTGTHFNCENTAAQLRSGTAGITAYRPLEDHKPLANSKIQTVHNCRYARHRRLLGHVETASGYSVQVRGCQVSSRHSGRGVWSFLPVSIADCP